MTTSMITANSPTVSEIRAPKSSRESRSRPTSSVPKQVPAALSVPSWKHGGSGMPCQWTLSMALGSNGDKLLGENGRQNHQGEHDDSGDRQLVPAQTRPKRDLRDLQILFDDGVAGKRERRCSHLSASIVLHARIEPRVNHVGEEVGKDHEKRNQHQITHQQREIALQQAR